jgi:hypothetical protein
MKHSLIVRNAAWSLLAVLVVLCMMLTGCHGARPSSTNSMTGSNEPEASAFEVYERLKLAYKLLAAEDPTFAVKSKLSDIFKGIPRQSLQDMDELANIVGQGQLNKNTLFDAVFTMLLMRDFQSNEDYWPGPHMTTRVIEMADKPSLNDYADCIWNSDWKTLKMNCWQRRVFGNIDPSNTLESWRQERMNVTPRA